MKFFKMMSAVLIGIACAQGAAAATTTLTFDEFPSQTPLTTQYQSVGVTITGVSTVDASATPWPANSGANVAYSIDGLMTFSLNPTILTNVQSVSTFVSAGGSIGIFAYDANGVLVGQAATVANPTNAILSVQSTGAPIASVQIHDGGSSFAIDTLSFTTVDAPVCADVALALYNAVKALADKDFKDLTKKKKLLDEVARFQYLVKTNASDSILRNQLYQIRTDIYDWVKTCDKRTALQKVVDQLWLMIGQHSC